MNGRKISMSNIIDRIIIVTLPIVVEIVGYFILKKICTKYSFEIIKPEGKELIKSMLGIWGTMIGFLITAVSILLALGNDKFINMLRDTGHFKTILFGYVYSSAQILLATVGFLLVLFVDKWNLRIFCMLGSITAGTMLSIGICLFLLFVLILRIIN